MIKMCKSHDMTEDAIFELHRNNYNFVASFRYRAKVVFQVIVIICLDFLFVRLFKRRE